AEVADDEVAAGDGGGEHKKVAGVEVFGHSGRAEAVEQALIPRQHPAEHLAQLLLLLQPGPALGQRKPHDLLLGAPLGGRQLVELAVLLVAQSQSHRHAATVPMWYQPGPASASRLRELLLSLMI